MQYKYVGNGTFYPTLPACDLDDGTLSSDQKAILKLAVNAGLYQSVPSSVNAALVSASASTSTSNDVAPKLDSKGKS